MACLFPDEAAAARECDGLILLPLAPVELSFTKLEMK